MKSNAHRPKPQNLLLKSLPPAEYARISPLLEEVPLTYGAVIYAPDDVIRHAYFPNSGIVSLLTTVDKSSTIEVGMIGREGVVGLSLFFGVERSATRAIVQGSGTAMRIAAADFVDECAECGSLARQLRRFSHSRISQVSQTAACYRFHQTESRLASWLLMTADRMDSGAFDITQEFLSSMLGVRREAVNRSSGILQHQELISHSRGKISIIDRAGLETSACVCYAANLAEERSFPAA